MFPKKFYRLIFTTLMSLTMSFMMSGIITYLNLGFSSDFFSQWLIHSFPKAWVAAFVVAYIVIPRVAKISEALVKKD
ncbi:hypothetical protein B6S12_01610 [Helicobacter valdiviensis]|uniref:DUF2798 domain-containing protein n=1 Tax=Helicobacter valdiviensis TaxID=1458358 RepID=A0A2W6NMV3_9HELI|nr:DUF2798 domain-containing protein [Helicobacter valdiviensis]PZT48776.1 hypothetical protein B6S12_01610 [Helicobacter valdiviensis]